jgi:type III secretory pathway component EscV
MPSFNAQAIVIAAVIAAALIVLVAARTLPGFGLAIVLLLALAASLAALLVTIGRRAESGQTAGQAALSRT